MHSHERISSRHRLPHGAASKTGNFQIYSLLSRFPGIQPSVFKLLLLPGLAFFPSILIGIIASTVGRMIIDLVSGVTPLQFVKGEWFVGTAVLSSVVYYLCYAVGLSIWPATLIALAVGFTFRIASMSKHWEEPGPWESREAIQKEKKEEKHAA